MRAWLALIFLLCALDTFANQTMTTVTAVVNSQKTKRLLLLSSVDGRVYKTEASKDMKDYLDSFIGHPINLSWRLAGGERIITGIQRLRASEVAKSDLDFFSPNPDRDSTPTDIGSYREAVNLFNMLNDGDRSSSQCFKRAHMWSWDMWTKKNVISQKIYVFYTRRYIQLEDFDWWFHVAPMVVADGVEYVLDRTFMNKPVTVKEWKLRFIKGEITCNEITKYGQYENNQWNRLCYLMKTPMWYFRPLDIKRRDEQGIHKNNWVLMELQDARRAFKDGTTVYEALDTGNRTIKH